LIEVHFYRNKRNRQQIIEATHARRLQLIQDDFIDLNGNATDGTRGRLTVTDKLTEFTPEQILLQLLLGKLKNNTITFEQLKTLIRLEHGFELTQTTRDKILIAVQGIIGTLRDRLKSAFGL